MSRVAVIVAFVSFVACTTTSPVVPAGVPPAAKSVGSLRALPAQRWCDEEAPPVGANAPKEVVDGINALAKLDDAALAKHVRFDVMARIERAQFLHAPDAVSVSEEPLDELEGAEKEVRALFVEAATCKSGAVALVVGEGRIDFPPAFVDTKEENALEIDAIHQVMYAGTSVTAYCGPCAMYALIVDKRADSTGLDVLAWDDLRGTGDPFMGHE